MKRILIMFTLTLLVSPLAALAQSNTNTNTVQPFKLGTFEIQGDTRIGIVLNDELIVELDAANQALERNPAYPAIPMPKNMRELISRYEYGLKYRLYEIVGNLNLSTNDSPISQITDFISGSQPNFVHDVSEVRTLAPLMPGKMLNAAVNFYSHVEEGGTLEQQRAAAEERRRTRGVPYLFIKPTEGAIIGNGDAVDVAVRL